MYLWSVLAIHSMPISVLLNYYAYFVAVIFPDLAFGKNFKCILEVEAIWSYNRPSRISASKAFLTVNNKITEQYRTTEAFRPSMQRLECSILRKGKVALPWEDPRGTWESNVLSFRGTSVLCLRCCFLTL